MENYRSIRQCCAIFRKFSNNRTEQNEGKEENPIKLKYMGMSDFLQMKNQECVFAPGCWVETHTINI
jgi:hypothetical protein